MEGWAKAMAKVAISRRHWVTSTPQACAAHQDDAPLEETSHSSLPSVPTEVEDATHVWRCQDPRALNVWTGNRKP
jgi:hypothetical protein